MSARRRLKGPTKATRRAPQYPPARDLAQQVGARPSGPDLSADLVQAHRRLEELYAISKLLTRFESVDRAVLATMDILARALRLRSAILMRRTEAGCETLAWRAETISDEDLSSAMARLQTAQSYLVAATEPRGQPPVRRVGPWAGVENDSGRFIVLPLAAEVSAPFGVLQIEGEAQLGELDLVFVNAATNQLAIALARQHAVEVDKAAAERRKRNAERRQLVAERGRARAEELEKAANAARREAERLKDLASTVTQSLAEGVIAVDIEGRITLLNPAAAEMLGRTEQEALGMPAEDVIVIRRPDGAPAPVEQSPFRIAMRTGESLRNDEQWMAARDRPAFAVGYTAAPLSRGGRITGAVLAFRNIMDVKRVEREQRLLAELSARLSGAVGDRATIEAIAHFAVPLVADLCVVDILHPNGDVREREVVIAHEQVPPARAELLKRFAFEYATHTLRSRALSSGRSSLVGNVLDSNLAAIAQDEEHACFLRSIGLRSVIVVPLCTHGETLGIMTCGVLGSERSYAASDLALVEEISRRAALAIHNARLYEQAKSATRARDELLAMVSHDLRNPLGVILTAISMVSSPVGREDPSRVYAHLPRIKRAAETMNVLLRDLLDTASIESGTLSVQREPLAAGPVVREVLETMQPRAAIKSLRLTSALAHDLPPVIADAGRLEQVLGNLVGNAIKFTEEGGAVTVRAEPAGSFVRFSVTDTGAGIPEADIPHLFDRFWKAGSTARQGTGLGLAIVKGIVEAHGGHVWVDSVVGVGSSFSFTLPLAAPLAPEHGATLH